VKIVHRRDYRCAGCNYGVRLTAPPRRCPMCGSGHWKPASRRG
jgi:rubrerythrin